MASGAGVRTTQSVRSQKSESKIWKGHGCETSVRTMPWGITSKIPLNQNLYLSSWSWGQGETVRGAEHLSESLDPQNIITRANGMLGYNITKHRI